MPFETRTKFSAVRRDRADMAGAREQRLVGHTEDKISRHDAHMIIIVAVSDQT